jgi:hypothetical protein
MRPLSASEAISPALDRTRDLLARPFRWQTFFKIAAVAFFAEVGGGSSFNLPSRGGGVHGLPPALIAFVVAFAIVIGLISLVVGLVLFYVGSRLQLVLVELVATRQTMVAPVWRRVSQTIWRWMGLKLLYFFAILMLFALVAMPFILSAIRSHALPSFDFTQLHAVHIFLLVVAALILLVTAFAGYVLLRDFALPHIALEDVSIAEALRRVRYMIADEPGAIALFLLLRFLLLIVFAIVAEIGIAIVAVISLIPFAMVGGGLWVALHHAGTAGTITLIGSAIVGALIFLCWLFFLGISGLGAVYTFSQAYSLYFLGGRYALVGNLLERSTPPPAFSWDGGYPGPYQPLPGAPPPPANP